MLKYLIIQLDDTSVSFCHYTNNRGVNRLIDPTTLQEALLWSMKENLTVQLLYPDYEIPAGHKALISGVDHADIVSSNCEDSELKEAADVLVFDSFGSMSSYAFSTRQAYVVRTTIAGLYENEEMLCSVLPQLSRLNIVITDINNLDVVEQANYASLLDRLTDCIKQRYECGHGIQLNLLTDRMLLHDMNNCGAGDESVTLSPDGNFHICPGFYLDNALPVGCIKEDLNIKNPQLYRLSHAPICRICDAWHCKRCIWLNKKMTLEVNTPSHEQCIMAHIERNASRVLLSKIRTASTFLPEQEITELSYYDPFEKLQMNR